MALLMHALLHGTINRANVRHSSKPRGDREPDCTMMLALASLYMYLTPSPASIYQNVTP